MLVKTRSATADITANPLGATSYRLLYWPFLYWPPPATPAALIAQAVDTFGRLDVLVNRAGILRDRMLFSTSEDEWDAVIRVHLKGTFAPSHHAARASHISGG